MMGLTKERLQEIAEDGFLKHGEAKAMARQLLAGLEQEPVAYIAKYESGAIHGTCDRDDPVKMEWLKRGMVVSPLYAAPQLPQPAVVHDLRDSFEAWAISKGWNIERGVISGDYASMWTYDAWEMVNACRAAMLQGAEPVSQHPELTVWYGSMPETNGKANWTAILHRKGEGRCMDGFTIDRSEYPGRVLYAADRVRYLIGEKADRPCSLDYDADAHSGYVKPGNYPAIPDDVRRMDWLVSKTVDVREPMVYGSHSLFWSQTITDEEDDYHATKLREQIDAAMAAENAEAPQQEVK